MTDMRRPRNQTGQNVQPRNRDTESVDALLELDTQGTVTIYSGKVELGTGVATAITQIVADELGIPFEHASIVMGDTARTPDQGTTAGSKTIQRAGPQFRQAAALARRWLLDRAAERLELPVDDLRIEDGFVRSASEGAVAVPVGDLAGEPFGLRIDSGDVPERLGAHTVVGRSQRRVDLLAKLTGGAAFVQDVRLDGMVHGRVIRPHVRTMAGIGATVAVVDDRAAREMPGVIDVVRDGTFIGVVAAREEQAIRAAEAVVVTWTDPANLPDQVGCHGRMRELVDHDEEILDRGDVEVALDGAAGTLESTYAFPYQAHASMGPSCAVADVRDDRATIYASTQGVYALRASLAPLLNLPEDRVRVIFREGAGCYGHNGADDVAADAAVLSRAVGRPVRLQWMRQDEFAWEPKSPAMLIGMRAGISAGGDIVSWQHETWTPTHVTRPSGQPDKLLVGQQVEPPMPVTPVRYGGGDRNAPTTYAFPNERVTMHWIADPPLRPSAFRSLGGMHNTTANEMFLDEVAVMAGIDPVELRLRYQDDPRAVDVIQAAAQAADWSARSQGTKSVASADGVLTGRGVAFVRYETEFTYVATVADIDVDPETGEVRVKRVVVAHDCGAIINPDGVRNQVEGNVIQGISRALFEEVTWDDRAVTSLTWEGYHILAFPHDPEIDVVLIDRPEESSLGAGEPAICTVAAAIGNAIFDATGARVRTLPFTPERVREAMAGCP